MARTADKHTLLHRFFVFFAISGFTMLANMTCEGLQLVGFRSFFMRPAPARSRMGIMDVVGVTVTIDCIERGRNVPFPQSLKLMHPPIKETGFRHYRV